MMNTDPREALVFRLPFSLLSISGADHVSFLHSILSQDIASMQIGDWREAALLSATSHVQSYMTAIKTNASVLLLSIEGQADSLSQKLNRFVITEDVQIKDISADWQLCEVWGPQKENFLKKLSSLPLADNQNFFKGTRFLLQASENLPPETTLGLTSSREMLRIENGIIAFGKDFDETIMLSETRLEKIAASETKGCYPGQEVVAKIETYKRLNRSFVQLAWGSLLDFSSALKAQPELPAVGAVIINPVSGEEIGRLTSRAYSPFQKKTVGLGWLKRGFFEQPIEVSIKSETAISAKTALLKN